MTDHESSAWILPSSPSVTSTVPSTSIEIEDHNIGSSSSSVSSPSSTTSLSSAVDACHSVLNDSIGILEQILSFVETADLVAATAVNRRWKVAGRSDALWEAATQRLWANRRGVYCTGGTDSCDTNNVSATIAAATTKSNKNYLIFWRALYSKERVRKMSEDEVRCIFQHPLLTQKRTLLEESLTRMKKNSTGSNGHEDDTRAFLERFFQLHMLDVMSDPSVAESIRYEIDDTDGDVPPRYFFTDLSFGSYACSVRDGRRRSITPLELCTPFGFEMFHKVTYSHEIAGRLVGLQPYVDNDDTDIDSNEAIMLCRHGKCFFESEQHDRQVRLEVRLQNVHSYSPSDLKWRWIDVGKLVKVGPYPFFSVSRRKDWGWKLENSLVVMYSLDGTHR